MENDYYIFVIVGVGSLPDLVVVNLETNKPFLGKGGAFESLECIATTDVLKLDVGWFVYLHLIFITKSLVVMISDN
ncbi:hypothetical protein VCRA2113O118_20085 [Vibrio crassostreae]|uniref:Uncharacterized protein n=1 Tax=Vibrio crassostreae TaxID=246167 RepID=A0A822MSA6_9VIBR|nr:hypothetical protein [Vibrio crassostreae]CAK1848929.1 hypothetical protein VCRA2113O119_10085 [Vibrio crassostreae]CAK1955193.1 hypothetical protein VCRA2114E123_20084 [Vibrio crassostreae]CAK1984190.1 hypothetical protein VCRA2110O113_20324 [Vibrio crassostreae]CAK1985333.1 hypothetical protein VCRA2114E122_20324 [Vibrio crassostreae]CAK1987712.1 hypothetical protein VCRA2113O120_20324 [Vibrio crassostreae]